MSFDEEWQQLQQRAVAHRAGTRLNGHVGGGGAPSDLSVRSDDLGRVGNDAFGLRDRLGRDGKHAQKSTEEAATALKSDNFRTGRALKTVHDTWDNQVKTLMDACAHISDHLDYTIAQHAKDEADISQSFTGLSVSRISEFFE